MSRTVIFLLGVAAILAIVSASTPVCLAPGEKVRITLSRVNICSVEAIPGHHGNLNTGIHGNRTVVILSKEQCTENNLKFPRPCNISF